MDPYKIIEKYYNKDSALYNLLINHSEDVTNKALSIVNKLRDRKIDQNFIKEASMLHDIGIYMTNAPGILCFGKYPYIVHGHLGSIILNNEGYPQHALVCERHTGAGLTSDEIVAQNLPLPHKDMMPLSIEEKIICFADCFFSKSKPNKEKTIDEARKSLCKFGKRSTNQFDEWCRLFL